MILKELLKLNEKSSSEKAEINYSTPAPGQFGAMVNIEGGLGVDMLADILGIEDNWKMVRLGSGYAAYDGERLSFFENKHDMQDEEDDEDHGGIEDMIDDESNDPASKAVKARLDKVKAKKAEEAKKVAAEKAEARRKRLRGE